VIQLPQLPMDGPRGQIGERAALRGGLAGGLGRPLKVLPKTSAGAYSYCAGCAGPIEFGPVIRGSESYCSVECSLGGDRPA
jgi:hypothetical protein